jgi:hypothetical protein
MLESFIRRATPCGEGWKAGHGTLWQATAGYNYHTSPKVVDYGEKQNSAHSSKQGEAFLWEALCLKDEENCSVVHSVECILDTKVLNN